VQNFPLLAELPLDERSAYSARENVVAYVGAITEVRGIRQMVDAIDLVSPNLEPHLELAGSFTPPSLLAECQQLSGWDRVSAHGWASRDQVRDILTRARVGLVVLQPALNYYDSYPTKLFEYLAAGIPVVASDFRLWREIISSGGFGLVVDPTDPRAIAEAVTYLLTHPGEAEAMGHRGRQAVSEHFNWEAEAKVLARAYGEALGS
jgi:glycosyltransferase involved in cell wall biosynthesis